MTEKHKVRCVRFICYFSTFALLYKKPDIKWNFTKFVVNRDGEVVARFEPTADMAEVEACIKELL